MIASCVRRRADKVVQLAAMVPRMVVLSTVVLTIITTMFVGGFISDLVDRKR